MCENIRDTLDLTYYEKLHDDAYDYSQVTVREYLDHLANKWCKLNTIVKKRMKDHFFRDWAEDKHISRRTAHGSARSTENSNRIGFQSGMTWLSTTCSRCIKYVILTGGM